MRLLRTEDQIFHLLRVLVSDHQAVLLIDGFAHDGRLELVLLRHAANGFRILFDLLLVERFVVALDFLGRFGVARRIPVDGLGAGELFEP